MNIKTLQSRIIFKTILFLFVIPLGLSAQDDTVILVIPNQDAKILLDGEDKGTAKANSALRITTKAGEHYIEGQPLNASIQNKGEILQLEPGKQKIFKIEFPINPVITALEPVQVADLNFNLPGTLDIIAWNDKSENKGKQFPVPQYYYAFEKGDEIILNLTMSNAKGTNMINVSTYPDGIERYTNKAFTELKDLKIKVPERGIYRFAFASNHLIARNAFFKISRIPASSETNAFNTRVVYKRSLTPVSVVEQQAFFINGGINATLSTGKSRVIVPVNLPANTAEWFYRFSASRDPKQVEEVKKNFSLFGDVTKILFDLTGAGAAVSTLAVEKLSQPPGANYCHIYFIEGQYVQH